MLSRFIARLRGLVGRRRFEAEADEEVNFHIEMEARELGERGLADAEARRIALARFGGPAQIREDVRDVRRLWGERLWRDLRHGLRWWRRRPMFSAAALLTLTVGIGATTAAASAVYGVLLKPLPVRDESSLFVGYASRQGLEGRHALSWPAVETWRKAGVTQELAAVATTELDLTDGVAERVEVQQVTGNFFRVLGLDAALGRVLSELDDAAAITPAVISNDLWRTRFAEDPLVLGRTFRAGRFMLTIVGVLPKRADRWRGHAAIWVPLATTRPRNELTAGYLFITPVLRLVDRPPAAAAEALTPLTAAIDGARTTVHLVSLRDDVSSPRVARVLLVLFASVCLTWFVVCANLSSLLLANGPARASEIGIRLAVGATRGGIVRQLLCESLLLTVPAGVMGLGVAAFVLRWASVPDSLGNLGRFDLSLAPPVVWFAAFATLVSAAACGLGPALSAGRAVLTPGAAALGSARVARRWSRLLVVGEIAVGVVVLVGAALLVETLNRIGRVDLGFDPSHVLVFDVNLPEAKYGSASGVDDDRYVQPQKALLSRLAAVPGVERVSLGGRIFRPGASWRTSVSLDDGRRFLNGEPNSAAFAPGLYFVGPDYFAVHGVRPVRGREFRASDHFATARVAIVNQALADLYWPGQDPIGRRLNFGYYSPRRGFDEPWADVIGVVPNVRHDGIDVPPRPYVYRATFQYPQARFEIELRSAVLPGAMVESARAAVRAFDPAVPTFEARPLANVVDASWADVRYAAILLTTLAGVVVSMAAFGIFSVLSYVVVARRKELAIRSALGATPRVLARMVVSWASWMLGPGIALGCCVAWASAGVLQALLFDVVPTDPVVFTGAVAIVVLVALAAAYWPSRRAARLDPVAVLKE